MYPNEVYKHLIGSPLGEVVFFVADIPIETVVQPGDNVVSLVTAVSNASSTPSVTLLICPPGQIPLARQGVPFSDANALGTWHYR